MNAKAVEEDPLPAPKDDVAAFASALKISDRPSDDRNNRTGNGPRDKDEVVLQGNQDNRDNRASGRGWDRKVRQWRPDWVQYDDYYRPVTPTRTGEPMRIVYIYQNAPRIAFIPPLGRIVLEVAQFAAYSFTALVINPINEVLNVAVGSFFGGGYFPGVGLPLPPPPPPLLQLRQRARPGALLPTRPTSRSGCRKIVDVGPDRQYGEQKVLLDGVTPAWGEWTQSSYG